MPDNCKKSFFIKTYGCQMNEYDSVQMASVLQEAGYSMADSYQNADLIVLNTCHIREKAAEKAYSELGRIKKLKAKPEAEIILAGCVAQAEGKNAFARAPFLKGVVGPQSISKIAEVANVAQKKVVELDFELEEKFDLLPSKKKTTGVSALISIQEGCDKFCSFCVVPYTRGPEFSRPVVQIISEVLQAVKDGAKEINLLGQNVSAYRGINDNGSQCDLGELLIKIAKIEGVERIRYATSHPRDMNDSLYYAHAEEKIAPFLHLPVQSGSNKVLKNMNRKHSREDYLKIIDKLTKIRQDIKFGTDIIIGFPGETDTDFEDTLSLLKEVNFIQTFSFKYSKRPGTPGSEMENQVVEDVKKERLAKFQNLASVIQRSFNESVKGRILNVLFERVSSYTIKDSEIELTGRSQYSHPVRIRTINPEKIMGNIMEVKITKALGHSLEGSI